MRAGTALVMGSLLWAAGCAHPAMPARSTVTEWQVALVDERLNHGAGGMVITDLCDTRSECEASAMKENEEFAADVKGTWQEGQRPYFVTVEEVTP